MKNKKIITVIIAIAVLSGLIIATEIFSDSNINSIKEVNIEKMESELGLGNITFVDLPDGSRIIGDDNLQIRLASGIIIQEVNEKYGVLFPDGWVIEISKGWYPIEMDNRWMVEEREYPFRIENVKIWEENNDSVLFLPDGTNITFVASTSAKVITQKSGTIIVRNSDGSYVVKLSDGYLVKTPDGIWIVSPRETIETKKVSVYFP